MPLIVPSERWLPACCACLTCFIGAYSSLLLASANLRLRHLRLTVLTALLFSVQCVFSIHFIAMSGIDLDQDWGFDVVLTLCSFSIAATFMTAAVTMAQVIRQRMQDRLQASFADCDMEETNFNTWLHIAKAVLSHTHLWKLTTAVICMAFGAAGCHHIGMWSLRGYPGSLVAVRLTMVSLPVTLLLGGLVSVLAVLAFVLLPCGAMRWLTAVSLTATIAAFHWTSAVWGMQYVAEDEFAALGPIVGKECILVLVVAQGALSQAISNLFSRMTIADHREARRQLYAAKAITSHITNMELEPVKIIELATQSPSALEKALFQIVAKLELYRPYLPDTLFIDGKANKEDGPTPCTSADPTDVGLEAGQTPPSPMDRLVLLDPAVEVQTPAVLGHDPKAPTPLTNMALGLTTTKVTVLRIALQHIDFRRGSNPDPEFNRLEVEEMLTAFLLLTVTKIKAHWGTVLSCCNGTVTAIWPNRTPLAGLRCAMAVKEEARWPIVQLVQFGSFLVGNLAAEQLSCFNVVGPLDLPGQQLLRLAWPADLVLVTDAEKETVELQYHCLPVEHVAVAGKPTTVYAVFPVSSHHSADGEWMYELAHHIQQSPAAHAQACWQAFTQGLYIKARDLAGQMLAVPEWYIAHLLSLIEGAMVASSGFEPVKDLCAAGWLRDTEQPGRCSGCGHAPAVQGCASPPLLSGAATEDIDDQSPSAIIHSTGPDLPGTKLAHAAFRGVRRHTGPSVYFGAVSTDPATSNDGAQGTLELPSRQQSDVHSVISLPNLIDEPLPQADRSGLHRTRPIDLERRFFGIAQEPTVPAQTDGTSPPDDVSWSARRGFFRRLAAAQPFLTPWPGKGKADTAVVPHVPLPKGTPSFPSSPNVQHSDLSVDPDRAGPSFLSLPDSMFGQPADANIPSRTGTTSHWMPR
eukprot:GGOE01009702.1.p1 GENE.GGOE01009702.1~~GGOE01009702.1.p1  ORF type:complete len:917 (-),score=222.18 GGOE01009702.1:820-3570(-)